MAPDQIGGCLLHLIHIQLVMIEIRIQSFCGNREFPVQDTVLICFFTVTVTGMKIRFHLFRKLDTDIFRKSLVQCIGKFFPGDPGLGIKNRHISKSMYPCICTAGTDGLNLFSKQLT